MAGVVAACAAATLTAAAALDCASPAADPAADKIRLVADGPATAQIIGETFAAYGGFAAWARRGSVEYQYTLYFYNGQPEPLRVSRQIHRLGLGDEVAIDIEDLDAVLPQVFRRSGESWSLTQGGAPVADASQIEFRRAYAQIARWTFLTPWNLVDDGARVESRGVRTPPAAGPVPVGPCDVLRLRFDHVTEGGGTDDWHDLYISRLSRLVERVHSYRAAQNDYRLAVWSDHRTFDGMRVATRRSLYASDAAGAVGRLEAVMEYAGVHFDTPRPATGVQAAQPR